MRIKGEPTSHSTYEDYLLSTKSKKKLTKKEYKEIIDTFFYIFGKSLIDTGYSYKLPYRLGMLQVIKRKNKNTSRKYINWAHWNETGEVTYHKNKHSEGWYAYINWDKPLKVTVSSTISLFKFTALKRVKTMLSEAVINNNTMNKYFQKVEEKYVTYEQ